MVPGVLPQTGTPTPMSVLRGQWLGGWGGQHMGAGGGVNMLQVEARFLTSAIEDVADDV